MGDDFSGRSATTTIRRGSRMVREPLCFSYGAGGLLLLATAIACWFQGQWAWAAQAPWFFLFFLLPVAGIGALGEGWPRRALQAFCGAVLVLFVGWAWSLERWIATARTDRALPGRGSAEATFDAAGMLELGSAFRQYSLLLLLVALSSWFVLLAPRGRGRRRGR